MCSQIKDMFMKTKCYVLENLKMFCRKLNVRCSKTKS